MLFVRLLVACRLIATSSDCRYTKSASAGYSTVDYQQVLIYDLFQHLSLLGKDYSDILDMSVSNFIILNSLA